MEHKVNRNPPTATIYRIALGHGLALSIVVPLMISAIAALGAAISGHTSPGIIGAVATQPSLFALKYSTPFYLLLLPLIMAALIAPIFVAIPMGVAEWRLAHGLPISVWSEYLLSLNAGTMIVAFGGALVHSAMVQAQLDSIMSGAARSGSADKTSVIAREV